MKNNDLSYENLAQKTGMASESQAQLDALYNEIKEEKSRLSKKEDQFGKECIFLVKSLLDLQRETLSALKDLQQKSSSAPEIKKPPAPVKEKIVETVFEVKVPEESKKEEPKPKTVEKVLPDNKKESKTGDDKKEIVFEVKLQTGQKEQPKTEPETVEKKEKPSAVKDEPVFEIKHQKDQKEDVKPKAEEKTEKAAKPKNEPVFEVKLRAK